MLVAGVDGCRGGWLCLLLDTSSREMEIRYVGKFAGLVRQKPAPKVIAVDIPIGLWERGDRDCDKAARALLGRPRSSSVFPPPPRSALKGTTYAEANALSRVANARGLSRQSFGILPKIREVDAQMTSERQEWIFEVHPEVSFWAINKRSPLPYSKKTNEGKNERLRLLGPLFPGVDCLLEKINSSMAGADDLLDAGTAVWTAQRIARHEELYLGSRERDTKGLRMEIVY